jgi:O-methyltransferase
MKSIPVSCYQSSATVKSASVPAQNHETEPESRERTQRRQPRVTQRATISKRVWNRLLIAMNIPILLSELFHDETGKEYGVGLFTKLRLVYLMARNRKRVTTGSHFLEHLLMATQILKVPKSVLGCVVECGSYKGGSATNLSLVCELCDRKLEIFDSFEGLPAPEKEDKEHMLIGLRRVHSYEQGAWCGTLPEVQRNIATHGQISVCNFNRGFFDQTLPGFNQPCILVFADVDLTTSLETCIKYLWPLLQKGSYLFTHEAQHLEISALFFDKPWWRSNLNCSAPGLIGAGTGIGLLPERGGYSSDLGFTIKNPIVESFVEDPQTGGRGRG